MSHNHLLLVLVAHSQAVLNLIEVSGLGRAGILCHYAHQNVNALSVFLIDGEFKNMPAIFRLQDRIRAETRNRRDKELSAAVRLSPIEQHLHLHASFLCPI